MGFEEVMSTKSDADLLAIITGPEDNYQPVAFDAAKKEFAKRNVPQEQVDLLLQKNKKVQKAKDAIAAEPLDIERKILTLLFPGLLTIIFASTYEAEGYDRKARELVRWTFTGLGFTLDYSF